MEQWRLPLIDLVKPDKKKIPWDHLSILELFKVLFSMTHEEWQIKNVPGVVGRASYEDFGKMTYRKSFTKLAVALIIFQISTNTKWGFDCIFWFEGNNVY